MTKFKSRDLLEVCRICSSPHQVMIKFFSDVSKKLLLIETINALLPVMVAEGDGFPQQVCVVCISKLRVCCDLFEECQQSESTFRSQLAHAKDVESSDEDDKSCIDSAETVSAETELQIHEPIVIPLDDGDTQNLNLAAVEEMNGEQKPEITSQDVLSVIITIPEVDLSLANQVTVGENIEDFPDLIAEAECLYQNSQTWKKKTCSSPESMKAQAAKLKRRKPAPVDESKRRQLKPKLPKCPEGKTTVAVLLADESEKDNTVKLFVALIFLGGQTLSDREFADRITNAYTEFKASYYSAIDGEASLVTTSTSFACFHCSLSFSNKLEMISHFQTNHPAELFYCSVCGEIVCGCKKDFKKHEMTHENKSISETDLLDKMTSQVNKPLELFKKKTCENEIVPLGHLDKRFKNYFKFVAAAKTIYTNSVRGTMEYSNDNDFEKELAKNCKVETFYCVSCSRCTTSAPGFKLHLEGIHYNNGKLQCDICHKYYVKKKTLISHMMSEHLQNTSLSKCEECNKFVPNHKMLTHKRNHNYFLQRRKCEYCYQLLAIKAWGRHKKINAQNGSNPKQYGDNALCKWKRALPLFECEWCKKLVVKPEWKKHSVFHKIYGPDCPFVSLYTVMETLKAHNNERVKQLYAEAEVAWNIKHGHRVGRKLRIRNKKSLKALCPKPSAKNGVKPKVKRKPINRNAVLNCDICGKSFKHRENITSHIKLHLKIGFRCRYCNKYFFKRMSLESHEALHRGERDYACPYCSKLFPSSRNVKIHIAYKHKVEHQRSKFLVAL